MGVSVDRQNSKLVTSKSYRYIGERHLVTVGRDPDGLCHFEERPGPEPDEGKRNSIPPFRVILTPEDDPAPGV